jgi:DNA-binding MarR family transcriptional regulator
MDPSTARARPLVRARLGWLLKHANLRLTELNRAALAPHGIEGRELAVLLSLDEREPLSQREAALRLGIDRTTMVALVDELEGKGLVERRPHPADRRKNVVTFTEYGRETLQRAVAAADEAERRFLAPLPAQEAHAFRDTLRRLIAEDADGAGTQTT